MFFDVLGHTEVQDTVPSGYPLLCAARAVLGHEGQHSDLQARLHRQRKRECFQLSPVAGRGRSQPIACG